VVVVEGQVVQAPVMLEVPAVEPREAKDKRRMTEDPHMVGLAEHSRPVEQQPPAGRVLNYSAETLVPIHMAVAVVADIMAVQVADISNQTPWVVAVVAVDMY
jgi:hypothetical protein